MAALDTSDIQFLGNWNSHQSTPASSFVSAIVLTPTGPVSSSSNIPRTFSRNQTSVIHVGRTPAADLALVGSTEDRATFANPVMSRNHAKITFADFGSVFIIDTNSHHGTWVARAPGEFKIAPESPFQLQDGDRLTFGKEVQRNGIVHKPLTLSVKLLRSASTPSSMSISSGSASPLSKVSSPKLRNRFGLDSSSDSDPSSDSEDFQGLDPRTGPNAIHVDPENNLSYGSPKPHKVVPLVQSDPSSPESINNMLPTPQHDTPQNYSESPSFESVSSADQPVIPDLEDLPMDVSSNGPSVNPNINQTATPPWRGLKGNSHRSNLDSSVFDRIPVILPNHSRGIGRIFNPPWVRSVLGMDQERGGIPSLFGALRNSSEMTETGHKHHEHGYHGHNLDREHHGHHSDHHGRRGGTPDVNEVMSGQKDSTVKDEVKTLGERLEALKKDIDFLKMKGEEVGGIHAVFSARLDELSTQLKEKIADDAKVSQQALFAELAGLNALRDSISVLQNDIFALRSSKDDMQSNIGYLRRDYEDLEADLDAVKGDSEAPAKCMSELRRDIASLQKNLLEVRVASTTFSDEHGAFKETLNEIRGDFSDIQGQLRGFQDNMNTVDIATHRLSEKINEMVMLQREMIREEVKSEMKVFTEQGKELPQITGKRKRSDETADVEIKAASQPTTSVSRSRKRLRVVADCAAAGAVGALGAWLGLAFL